MLMKSRSAVLMLHGEKAHSCYFSRDAFAKLQGENKELLIVPNAVHTDLYDQMDVIPFDRMEKFFKEHLNGGKVQLDREYGREIL